MYDSISFFGMPIKTLGSLGKIRVGRVTGNTHNFFFGLRQTSVINNSSRSSLANLILKSHVKALAHSPMGEITVDPKGVLKLLNGLNIHKAPGLDGLSARVLKECSSEIAPILTLIYNESLAQGTVPDDWRQANVAAVFKKDEKYNAANYRPVSLKPLSHQDGVLTVIPRRPKKMQNAEVRAVRTQASPQQRSGIAIGRGGIA